MIILSKEQVLKLHVSLIKATRGSAGILVLASVILVKRKSYNGLLNINNKFSAFESETY